MNEKPFFTSWEELEKHAKELTEQKKKKAKKPQGNPDDDNRIIERDRRNDDWER